MAEYLLEMHNICKKFPGVVALDQAQLCVRPGSVHALVGENGAGKSTLMKCLFGIYSMDSGDIALNGESVSFANPRDALLNGVSMVHQELDQLGERNVLDNIWLGRFPTNPALVIDEKKMYKDTFDLFAELNLDIDPRAKLKYFSVSTRQMVEIAKAVSYRSKIIVLDEPTSSLTEKEVAMLFEIIRKLQSNGCGIIYISHKMEEILEIADEITIMRDGKWISTKPVQNITIDNIISAMVGRDMTHRFPPKDNVPGEKILEVKNLTTLKAGVKNVTFDLHAGEVLGVAGLVGSRRTELLETIFGTKKKLEGEVVLRGKSVRNRSSSEAIRNKFAFLTEERRFDGIFPLLSVQFNTVIANLGKNANWLGVIKEKMIERDTKWTIENLRVKVPTQKTPINTLSGGNQQKVLFGRWLLTDPDVLLLDEPTRGIDVGAKYEIYQFIFELARKGKGVIVVSSEMPELMGISDRIMVMSNGRLADIVDARGEEPVDQEQLFRLAAKHL